MGGNAGARRLSERYPVVTDLREAARRRIPRFAFEYIDGGAGTDGGIRRNWSALDAVVLLPRYGSGLIAGSCEVCLFGRPYACPIGVAPMGAAGVTWPGSERVLARAAQSARIPYVLSTVAGLSIEDAAALAPDVFWFQLYRLSGQDLSDTIDLVRRASAAGAHVLVATLDAGVRSVRPREVRGGMRVPFRPTPRAVLDILSRPRWLAALARHGARPLERADGRERHPSSRRCRTSPVDWHGRRRGFQPWRATIGAIAGLCDDAAGDRRPRWRSDVRHDGQRRPVRY